MNCMSFVLPTPTPEQRRTAAAQFDRARQFLAAGQPLPAIGLLLECCRADPANVIYRQELRRAQRARLGRRNTSRFAGLLTWLPRRRLRAAPAERVLELAEEVLYLDPWNAEAHVRLADVLAAGGAEDAALWCLEQAHAVEPRDNALRERLARMYEEHGRFMLARELRMGERGRGLPEEVVAGFRARMAARPGDPEPYLQLAEEYARNGRPELAREALQEGWTASNNNFAVGVALAHLDIDGFRQDLAIADERSAQAPEDATLAALRQRLRQEINTREIALYQQLADRFPGEANYRFELGARLLKAGQFDEALAAFEAVRGDERLRWRALVYAGYCQLNRRKWPQAAALFEEALPLVPAEEEATRRELLALLASGRQV
jgi:tetratricopeptide (TPR) repeat protein